MKKNFDLKPSQEYTNVYVKHNNVLLKTKEF